MRERCVFCDAEIPPGATSYRQVVGFEKLRARGGANSVTLRETTGFYACHPCVVVKRSGFDDSQPRLFDPPPQQEDL